MHALPIKDDSAWQSDELSRYLSDSRNPLRLSVLSAGRPLIVPLWYLVDDGYIWCASKPDAFVTRCIGNSASCGFDVSDNTIPYRGVRGQGTVDIVKDEGECILRELVKRYLPDTDSKFARWLLKGAENEVAIRISPEWITAWDFGQRMKGISPK